MATITLDSVTNFAIGTVSTGYAAGATSIVLSAGDGALFPNPPTDNPFNVVWWDSTNYANPADDPLVEIVRCTSRSSNTLTVTRAQEGTANTNKNTGGATYKMMLAPTQKYIEDIDSAIRHLEGTASSTRVQSQLIIDDSGSEALLVRADGDTGDHFSIHGTTGEVFIGPAATASTRFRTDTTLAKAWIRAQSGDTGTQVLLVEQDTNNICLDVQKDGTGAGVALRINNAGTGHHLDTDAGAGTPAHLTNTGTWTNASCWEELKQDFEPLDNASLLQRLEHLPIQYYRSRRAAEIGVEDRTLGPLQNDLVGLFGLNPDGVRPHEIAAIAIAGVQQLLEVVRDQAARITALEGGGSPGPDSRLTPISPPTRPPMPVTP